MKINTYKAGQTGIKPTANAGFEQGFPMNQRIIIDDLAPKMFSGVNGFWMKLSKYSSIRNLLINLTEKVMPGGWSMFLVRKRYIDSVLLETLKSKKIYNIVNLGAGMDTRLYRFEEVQDKKCYEMDQPDSVRNKRQAIVKAKGVFPNYIQQIPINFIEENIGKTLQSHGYDPSKTTFFIWEAVTQYLDMKSIEGVFEFFSNSPKNSYLAFTYILKDFVEGTQLYNETWLYNTTVKTRLWISSFHPEEINAFLKKYGWEVLEEVSYDILDKKYVSPTGRKLAVCPVERVVFARKFN